MRLLAIALLAVLAKANGTIRVWGDSETVRVFQAWQTEYQKQHADIRFDIRLLGTGTGMASLYTDVADLAVLGRAATPKEVMAFEWVHKYKPLELEVLTGSLAKPGKSPALVVFVNRENPITRLSFDRLRRIFECSRGAIRTWGDLGLAGEWTAQPIRLYMPDAETGTAFWFRWKVLGGSQKWRWGDIREFADESGRAAVNALALDRYGLALSNLSAADAQVKAIALAPEPGGSYFEPTSENLMAREYPLGRSIFVYVNRAPGKAVDGEVKRFLQYVLSPKGQSCAARVDEFLPLPPGVAREQLARLE